MLQLEKPTRTPEAEPCKGNQQRNKKLKQKNQIQVGALKSYNIIKKEKRKKNSTLIQNTSLSKITQISALTQHNMRLQGAY